MSGIIRMAGLALAWFTAQLCYGQLYWAPTGAPGLLVAPLQGIYASPSGDTLYFGGILSMTGVQQDWQETNSILRYTAGQWDTLGVINGQVMTVVQYRDTLLAGGHFFLSCSGLPCSQVAYWDGINWRPYGEFGAYHVRQLRVLEGELYAVGGFNEVDGQPASGVAKRVGSSWEAIGSIDDAEVRDIVKYQGKLVVAGRFELPGGRDIAEWDGAQWQSLGPGIIDLMSGPRCLAVYQDELYVGGQIALAPPANPGQNIMRWDGTQFHALGQGVQQWPGNTTAIATVTRMVEHAGKLFVGGGFRAAGGIEAMGLATWDGIEWCGVPGDFQATGGIYTMDFYHDTLFVACGTTLDGVTVNGTAKFIGEQYENECSGPVGLIEAPEQDSLGMYPNPSSGEIYLHGFDFGAAQLRILDMQGRTVQGAILEHEGTPVDVRDLQSGSYLVEVLLSNGRRQTLRWVKQ